MDLTDLDLAPSTLLLLWAARETGALDALATDADTPAEVATTADIDDRAAELVVDVLERAGFLERVGEAVQPTDPMLGFLAAADLRSVGRLPGALDTVDALVSLPETMRTGRSPGTDDGPTGVAGDALMRTLGQRAAMDDATVRAVTTAAVRQAPDATHVVDVAGAPGHYARAFAALGKTVSLADRQAAIDRSMPLLAPTDIDTVAVDPGDSLPDGDLVFAGDVARRRPAESAAALVDRLADAAAPGGAVVLADLVAGWSDVTVPATVRAYARHGGGVHEEDRYVEWFEDADLEWQGVHDVPGCDRQVVVGTADR